MRSTQQTLLAGFAALALFAASGIASAQQGQTGASGAAQSSAQSLRGQQGANTQGRNTFALPPRSSLAPCIGALVLPCRPLNCSLRCAVLVPR